MISHRLRYRLCGLLIDLSLRVCGISYRHAVGLEAVLIGVQKYRERKEREDALQVTQASCLPKREPGETREGETEGVQ